MIRSCGTRKKIKEILRRKKGFTLTELLVATLIMVLATGALTSAMILAIRHFYQSTQETEAQFLCASLAEFVEDELSFSTFDPTDGDLTWSKGTHNMGNQIRFSIQTEGASGPVPVSESTIGTYGKIVISGDNYRDENGVQQFFHLVSDGSYEVGESKGYSLLAGMSMKWFADDNGTLDKNDDKKWFEVEIRVVDKNDPGKVLSTVDFTVKPAIVTE